MRLGAKQLNKILGQLVVRLRAYNAVFKHRLLLALPTQLASLCNDFIELNYRRIIYIFVFDVLMHCSIIYSDIFKQEIGLRGVKIAWKYYLLLIMNILEKLNAHCRWKSNVEFAPSYRVNYMGVPINSTYNYDGIYLS